MSQAQQTKPQGGPSHGGLIALRPSVYELVQRRGGRNFRGFGKGFGLNVGLDDAAASPGPIHGEEKALADLQNCRGLALTPSERDAYAVLVEMYCEIGWDQLLARRSKVFLMEDEGADADDAVDGKAGTDNAVPPQVSRVLPRRISSRLCERLFQTLHADLELFHNWNNERSRPHATYPGANPALLAPRRPRRLGR
eukprot:gnl/TRDRNA2_/TRDRNA2_166511_c0_seq4.p1 gnl/TRDRNA2_/TRDRNA2_166511_c0~~gnl/TRDRNA2_/TRDRNA2_166511_c0_seq4.p1  ORF type:complete len:196 (+),score=28.86 gnl/TRDRNA2_/TRDRNA2_166511_c0_seq4:193-780(+)